MHCTDNISINATIISVTLANTYIMFDTLSMPSIFRVVYFQYIITSCISSLSTSQRCTFAMRHFTCHYKRDDTSILNSLNTSSRFQRIIACQKFSLHPKCIASTPQMPHVPHMPHMYCLYAIHVLPLRPR